MIDIKISGELVYATNLQEKESLLTSLFQKVLDGEISIHEAEEQAIKVFQAGLYRVSEMTTNSVLAEVTLMHEEARKTGPNREYLAAISIDLLLDLPKDADLRKEAFSRIVKGKRER